VAATLGQVARQVLALTILRIDEGVDRLVADGAAMAVEAQPPGDLFW